MKSRFEKLLLEFEQLRDEKMDWTHGIYLELYHHRFPDMFPDLPPFIWTAGVLVTGDGGGSEQQSLADGTTPGEALASAINKLKSERSR